ncbi:MAG TPA: hypothetical protein DF383_05085 [Deltaproteobacteria bacterium]|nr:hypothetical protein [Deltaproteobacteria bacterium]
MPPSGGGGVNNSPRSGKEIVQNMFEGQKAKPTDAQQQAVKLRQETQAQEKQRSAPQEKQSESRGADSGRSEAQRASGAEESLPPVRESEMDAFLARSSEQAQQRDAGRSLSRPQTLSSVNVQAWSVANSPNTSESARTLLYQRQQAGQPQTQAGAENKAGARNAAPATMLPTLPRLPAATSERALPLIIQYARTYSSGGETAARAFTGRPFVPENFTQNVQRLLQNQMGAAAQQLFAKPAEIAVHVRGHLVFVKDSKELRAFRLNKDGTFSELPSDDSSDKPLSPEAQSLMQKVLRQKGIRTRGEGGSLHEAAKSQEAQQEAGAAEKSTTHEEGVQEELDFETRFALLLHEVLEENRDLEKSLNGEDPSFPVKSDWEAFFARMIGMGNQEKKASKSLESILAMVFRGLFKKQGQSNVLVGDLRYAMEGKTKEEKFAQILLQDEKFLKLFQKLKPGQKISAETLKEIAGEEIDFLKLAHTAEQTQLSMAESSGKNIVFNPKSNIDAFSQARLEHGIFAARKKSISESAVNTDASPSSPPLEQRPASLAANVYELLGLRERYRGRPRFYTFVVYSVLAAILGILLGSILLGM